MSDRTLRQRLVPEIGDEGQARIARTTAHVSVAGHRGDVAARYLAFAGFSEVRAPSAERASLDDTLSHRLRELVLAGADPAVIDVAMGAASALAQIRAAVKTDR